MKPPEQVSSMNRGPEEVLWDTSHRQVVEPLAIRLYNSGQTREKNCILYLLLHISKKKINLQLSLLSFLN